MRACVHDAPVPERTRLDLHLHQLARLPGSLKAPGSKIRKRFLCSWPRQKKIRESREHNLPRPRTAPLGVRRANPLPLPRKPCLPPPVPHGLRGSAQSRRRGQAGNGRALQGTRSICWPCWCCGCDRIGAAMALLHIPGVAEAESEETPLLVGSPRDPSIVLRETAERVSGHSTTFPATKPRRSCAWWDSVCAASPARGGLQHAQWGLNAARGCFLAGYSAPSCSLTWRGG